MPKKDIELSQKVKASGNKKRKKRPFSKLMTVFMIIALALLIFQLIHLDLLPLKLVILISLVLILLVLIILLVLHYKAKKFVPRLLILLVSICMCVGLAYGNYFLYKTNDTFDVVTSLADSKATTTSIVALKDTNIKKEKNLNNKTIGTLLSADKEPTKRMLNALDSNGIQYKTKDYSSLDDLMQAFYNKQVDAICLNEKYRDILHETEEYFSFQTDTRVVYQNVHYTKVKKNDNPSDPVSDITKDAFTVLVSGNDSYGTLQDSNTRSDANLLLTVNPTTHTILMTSIPRDYYVDLVCPSSGELACPAGSKDKLTHSGLMGVKSTEKTIEKVLGININYNVRINFSSVVNLVDALDGIDLDIKEGEQVDIFYVNSQPGLSVGKHHVDGETALAFARERHAYADGDNQRVRNQQKVFKAIFNRIVSPKMITNYGKFMDALAVAFDTNVSGDEISEFIKFELNNMPDWKFESYSLVGESGNEFCYEAQSYASIVYPNVTMDKIAKKKIQAVLNGKSSTTVKDTSGYSQTPSKDNAVGNAAELQALGQQNDASYDYQYDDSDAYYDEGYTYDDSNVYQPDDNSYYYGQDDFQDNGY